MSPIKVGMIDSVNVPFDRNNKLSKIVRLCCNKNKNKKFLETPWALPERD